jgi:uncharacterized damage-inducible protein DinB
MSPEEVRLLYDYNTWANHRILDASGALTGEQFTRELGGSFRSARGTLVHIMGAEWLWLERWHGRLPSALLPAEEFPGVASVRARWAQIETDLLRFVAGLTPADLARVHEYRTTKGTPVSNPLWQSLQHVVNYGSYHRGQVTTLLRQLGASAVATDLIQFYRERQARASA